MYTTPPFAACLSFLIAIEVSSNIVIDNVQCNLHNNVIIVQKLNMCIIRLNGVVVIR